jgi:N-acetylglucosamine kinase
MSYILGLDGGGTKTLIALVDRTGEVIRATYGASLDPTAAPNWPDLLSSQLAEVMQDRGPPVAAVLGLSFHDEIKSFTAQQEEVAAALLPSSSVLVENDVRLACEGAFALGPGVLMLAGTGSMVWASRGGPEDAQHRIGGFGDVFGDEGSAYWIGRESLAIASQGLDGRLTEAEGFGHAIAEALSISSDGLIDWMYSLGNRRTAIAGIAQITARLADSGSPVAQTILDRACDHLSQHVLAAERALSGPGGERLPWSYAGGVFSNASILEGVQRRVGTMPVDPILPPVGGALLRAARLAGWSTDNVFITRLKQALRSKT